MFDDVVSLLTLWEAELTMEMTLDWKQRNLTRRCSLQRNQYPLWTSIVIYLPIYPFSSPLSNEVATFKPSWILYSVISTHSNSERVGRASSVRSSRLQRRGLVSHLWVRTQKIVYLKKKGIKYNCGKKKLWRSIRSIHVFDSISTTALEVGLSLGSCTQQPAITSPMKCTSWLSEGIGGRPPSRTVNITELSFFFDENGILSVKIYTEGIQDQ